MWSAVRLELVGEVDLEGLDVIAAVHALLAHRVLHLDAEVLADRVGDIRDVTIEVNTAVAEVRALGQTAERGVLLNVAVLVTGGKTGRQLDCRVAEVGGIVVMSPVITRCFICSPSVWAVRSLIGCSFS